jgi:hypothetical protein
VSNPAWAELEKITELDLNKTYESFIGTYWHQFLVPEKGRANACQKKTCQRVPEKDVPTRARKKKKFNKYSTVIYTSCVYHDEPRPLHVPCTQSAYK